MASHLQRPPDLPNCRKLWISAASAVCLTEKCHEKMDCEPSCTSRFHAHYKYTPAIRRSETQLAASRSRPSPDTARTLFPPHQPSLLLSSLDGLEDQQRVGQVAPVSTPH